MSDAKEYLLQIGQWDAQINSKLKHRDALREQLTHITPVLKEDAGSGGGFQDKICNGVSKLVDLEREIDEDIDRLVDLKKEALGLMEKLTNAKYYTVLHDRYILSMKWESIAGELGISRQGTLKIHGRALQVFGKLMRDR